MNTNPIVRALTLALTVATLCVSAPLAIAQAKPHLALLGITGELVELKPDGTATTLFTAPSAQWMGGGLRPSINNRGVAMVHEIWNTTGSVTQLSEWQFGGGMTTIATISSKPASQFPVPGGSDLLVDQDGDYIVSNAVGLFRVTPVGGRVSTIATTFFTRITHNLPAGDWTATTGFGPLVDVTAGGVITTLVAPQFPGPQEDLRVDPRNGDLFYVNSGLFLYNRTAQTFASYGAVPGLPGSMNIDPADGNLLLAGVDIVKLDRTGTVLQTITQTPPTSFITDLAVVGSRHLAAVSPAVAGSTYQLLASFPADAGAPYLIGASFGFNPGIPTAAGTIPLQTDQLLTLSQTNPFVFQGFAGVLNARGEAVASIKLPNGARGVKFYLAALSIVNNTIGTISEPIAVTVR